MKGNDFVSQPGGRGQAMGDWGAKTVTTTTSARDGERRLEEKFAGFLRAALGSSGSLVDPCDQRGLQLPVAEQEQNGEGVHVRARLVICHNHSTMSDYKDHIGPYWPGYPGIANLIIL